MIAASSTVRSTPSKSVLAYRRKMFIAGLKEATISGMPCLIEVDTCRVVKGSFSYNAASDMDYLGYSEVEFTVYDRKGYRAVWLEKKMTDDEKSEIEQMIIDSQDGDDDCEPDYND